MKKRNKPKRSSKTSKEYALLKGNIFLIPIRYVILLLIMVFGLPVIYYILTPLTVYSAGYLLKLFYPTQIAESLIVINSETFIKIIPPCIAGSAYLLLLILNLTVPMNLKKRFFSITLSFVILFVLNVLRIVLLSSLLANNNPLFDFSHKLFWYSLSTLFVILIWFLNVKIFSIKEIPVYSDIRSLMRIIKS